MTDTTPATFSEPPNRMSDALAYARRGWAVLPVFPGEKRPRLKDWPERATTDTDVIRDWWVTMPDSNIGLATGRASGFFVLDIDPKSGGYESLARLEAEHSPLPYTYTVQTGSGGSHYYFALPEDFEVTNSPGRIHEPGVDVRGTGGQVLAPPSQTVVGGYRVRTSGEPAPAPDWLLDLLRPVVPLRVVDGGKSDPDRMPAADFDRCREYAERVALPAAVAAVAQTTEGGRNQALNDEVLALAGIAAHDAALLEEWNVHDAMISACADNGLLSDDGRASFEATFRSAWSAGLTKPRQDWPPRERNAGIAFGVQPTGRPTVNITGREHHDLTDEVLGHIVTSNHDDPRLFLHGTEVVAVNGEPAKTTPLDANMLAYEASARMLFVRAMPKGGQAVASPPERIVATIASMADKPLPRLNRVSFTPYFSPTGRLITEPGYDEEARTFYSPAAGVEVPPIPEEPTSAQVEAAKRLLLDELLVDFPFVTEADRTHAVALMLLPFVRDLIVGATPLHDIEAPTPGSGKGLLMKAVLMPGVGPSQSVMSAATDDDEWQKRLIAFLRDSPQAIVIDNVNTKVDSGALCTVLTEPVYASRILGASQAVTLPVRCVWVLTGNNPQFSGEVSRRCLRIRLDPRVERPEERGGFRHERLAEWCRDNRGALITACCTLVRSWVVAGMPKGDQAWGSFEEWSAVMGGLLGHLGFEDFLGNRREFLAEADEESNAWENLITLLDSTIVPGSVQPSWTAANIAAIVDDAGIPIDLGATSNRALAMGRALGKQRGRWYKGARFESKVVNGATRWYLTRKPNL